MYKQDKKGIGSHVIEQHEMFAHCTDVSSIEPIEYSMTSGKQVLFYTTHAITQEGPYEINMTSDGEDYTYLPLTRLEGEIEVIKKDGTAIGNTEEFSCNSLPVASIFRQVEVTANGQLVNDQSTSTYPYKCCIETELSHTKDAKETHLFGGYYLTDDFEKEEVLKSAESTVFTARKELLKKKLFFSTLLHVDFFYSHKLLIPKVNINLKFIRNTDDFALICETSNKYAFKFNKLWISARRITLKPQVHEAIERSLMKAPANYPIKQSKIRTFTIEQGTVAKSFGSIIQGVLPTTLIFALVKTAGFDGKSKNNPFFFHNFGVNFFDLKINGVSSPSKPYQPDYASGDYMREYRSMMDNCGIQHENETNGITFVEFGQNKTFYVYDLSPDLCNGFHNHPSVQGYIDLTIAFKEATKFPITIICYGSYSEHVIITKDRQVSLV